MRPRRLSADVTDRCVCSAALLIVVVGSMWGLLDAGSGSSSDSRASSSKVAVHADVSPSTLPVTNVATLPSATSPVVTAHPELFRGLGRLAYVSAAQLYVLDGTGLPPRPVPGAVDVGRSRWSHDGEWLAYQLNTDQGLAGSLHVIRADGTNDHKITAAGTIADWEWSPTSDALAFVEGRANVNTTSSVETVDVTSGTRRIVATTTRAYDVSWSQAGNSVAYVSYAGGYPSIDDLFITDLTSCAATCAAATRQLPLVVPNQADNGLELAGWTPDGSRVLAWIDDFHSGSSAMDGLPVLSVPVDGSSPTNLPVTLTKPSWVIPVSDDTAVIDTGGQRDWTARRVVQSCSLRSGECTDLVTADGPTLDPALSPGGRQLAYVQTDALPFTAPGADPSGPPVVNSARWSASRRLVIANADGTAPEVIADGGVIEPRWSRDGRHLTFARSGYLWLVPSDGSTAATPIVAVDERRPTSYDQVPFEQYPYVMPGDDVWSASDWTG